VDDTEPKPDPNTKPEVDDLPKPAEVVDKDVKRVQLALGL